MKQENSEIGKKVLTDGLEQSKVCCFKNILMILLKSLFVDVEN